MGHKRHTGVELPLRLMSRMAGERYSQAFRQRYLQMAPEEVLSAPLSSERLRESLRIQAFSSGFTDSMPNFSPFMVQGGSEKPSNEPQSLLCHPWCVASHGCFCYAICYALQRSVRTLPVPGIFLGAT